MDKDIHFRKGVPSTMIKDEETSNGAHWKSRDMMHTIVDEMFNHTDFARETARYIRRNHLFSINEIYDKSGLLVDKKHETAKDEGLHYMFAITLYNNHIVNKMEEKEFKEMLKQAVDTGKTFVRDSLPVELLGTSSSETKNISGVYCQQNMQRFEF